MKDHILHEKKEFVNVRELIEWAAQEYGEKTAYSYRVSPTKPDITKVSFIKFRNDVRALATEMLDMGCADKHCVIVGKFSYEWAVTYYATLCIGAVLVPLDRDWLAQDLADTATRADVSYLFCDEDIADKAEVIADKADLDAEPIYLNAKNSERNLRALINDGREKFTQSPKEYYSVEIDTGKMSLLVFTSGTTGKGKGVMLSQTNIVTDITQATYYFCVTPKTLMVLPPHHTFGSSINVVGHFALGSEVYISSGLKYLAKEM